jgi:hypothetical protein
MHNIKLETMTTTNDNQLHFHVAFFVDNEKQVLSGKTYACDNIVEAIEAFIHDSATPSMSRIKYISCEENMTPFETIKIDNGGRRN